MKAILMSIKPKWCELIFSGDKTIEVRKTAPKLKPPFKVYMYCTKARHKPNNWMYHLPNDRTLYFGANARDVVFVREEGDFRNGMIIGEFVCDKIIGFSTDWINGVSRAPLYIKGTCITGEQLFDYSKGKRLYGLHITEPKRYDTPKNIKKFLKPCPYGDLPCRECPSCEEDESGYIQCFNTVNRPPQSWMYVEEIEE